MDIERASKALERSLIDRPGIAGTAIGMRGGKHGIKVYVSSKRAKAGIPKRAYGFPVWVVETGPFRAETGDSRSG